MCKKRHIEVGIIKVRNINLSIGGVPSMNKENKNLLAIFESLCFFVDNFIKS